MRYGKQDVVIMLSDKTGYSKQVAHEILTAFTDIVSEKIKCGDDIVIPGFGSWKLQKVSERKGRNIRTDEEIIIPAHNRVKFTPGKELKENAASFGKKKVDLTKKPKKQ